MGRPADDVWSALRDPERVFGCIPGARYLGRQPGGAHVGSLAIDVDPDRLDLEVSIVVTGTGRRSATADLRVVDRGSGGRARGSVTAEVEGHGLFSMIQVSADVTLTGSVADAARRGYLGEASQALAAAFAECLDRSFGVEIEGPAGGIGEERDPAADRPGLWARFWEGLRRR